MTIFNAQAIEIISDSWETTGLSYTGSSSVSSLTFQGLEGEPKSWSLVGYKSSSGYVEISYSTEYITSLYYDGDTSTIIGSYVDYRGRTYRVTSGITTSYEYVNVLTKGRFTITASSLKFPVSSDDYYYRLFYTV